MTDDKKITTTVETDKQTTTVQPLPPLLPVPEPKTTKVETDTTTTTVEVPATNP